jgi:biopolymer transport protein ExbD
MRRIILRLLAVLGVLAILFLITTAVTSPGDETLILGENEKPKDPSNFKEIIELVLAENGRIYVYQGNMDNATLLSLSPDNTVRSYFQEKKQSITDSVLVMIRTTNITEMRTTVDVLDEMTINGIKNFAVQHITPAQEKKFLPAINGSKSANDDTAMK